MDDMSTRSVMLFDEQQDVNVAVQATTGGTPGVLLQVDSGRGNSAVRLTADQARALAAMIGAAAAVAGMNGESRG